MVGRQPAIYSWPNNVPKAKASVEDSGTFAASTFVRITNGKLVVCSTDDTAIYGLTPDADVPSSGELSKPPFALFGERHWPFDPEGAVFVMSVVDSNNFSTTTGKLYTESMRNAKFALRVVTSGSSSLQCIDADDTGTANRHLVEVLGLHPINKITERNPWVLARVVSTAIQN